MTRQDLINIVAKKVPYLRKGDVKLVIREALDEIEKTLKNGERVSLCGLGSWYIKEMPEKKFRNPQTGEYFIQGPKKYLKWATAIKLKDAINE